MAEYPVILCLCMIVRNSARTLRAALQVIHQYVDQLVVVDTGSTDNTREIAREFGAEVYEFPWIDDFAAARNASFSHSRAVWNLWMDSDDTIDEENARKIRELAYRSHPPEVLAHDIQVHCPTRTHEETGDVTIVDHLKLVRNHPALRFEGRIHEQLLGAIQRLGGRWEWTDIFVVHSGADHSPEGRQEKNRRDLRILELQRREQPNHSFVDFNLGMTHHDMEQHVQAVECLERCLRNSHPLDSTVRKAYAFLVGSLFALGKISEALAACDQGLAIYPEDPELWFRQGGILLQQRRPADAVHAYQRALGSHEPRHLASVERGIGSFLSRQNLAVAYLELGRTDLAELELRRILEHTPHYRPAYLPLAKCLVSQGRLTSLEMLVADLTEQAQLTAETNALRALLADVRNDVPGARQLYATACAGNPRNVGLWRTRSEFLFRRRVLDEAVVTLTHLRALDPQDPSVPFNLGLTFLCQHQPRAAAAAFREALTLDPHYQPAEAALQDTLRLGEAA